MRRRPSEPRRRPNQLCDQPRWPTTCSHHRQRQLRQSRQRRGSQCGRQRPSIWLNRLPNCPLPLTLPSRRGAAIRCKPASRGGRLRSRPTATAVSTARSSPGTACSTHAWRSRRARSWKFHRCRSSRRRGRSSCPRRRHKRPLRQCLPASGQRRRRRHQDGKPWRRCRSGTPGNAAARLTPPPEPAQVDGPHGRSCG